MTEIVIVGNIGSDPELKFTPSGTAVCSFPVADQQRRKNPQSGEWEDGDTTWYRVNVWREHAENVAESLNKGDRVIVRGRVALREYTTSDGSQGKSLEIQADAVGPDTKWAQVTVRRVQRQAPPSGYGNQGGQQQGGQYGGQQRPQGGQQRTNPAEDPWGSAPAAYGQGQQGFADEPPF
jgi:single-strand DNA-binding protein